MSLPSQSPRAAATGRAVMRTHRRHGLRIRPLALVAGVAAVATAAVWYMTRDEPGRRGLGPEEAGAGHLLEAPHAQPPRGSERSLAGSGGQGGADTARPAAARSEPAPLVISQKPVETREGESSLGAALRGSGETPPPEAGATPGDAQERKEPPAASVPAQPESSGAFGRAVSAADAAIERNDPVAARSILNRALADPGAGEQERTRLRARLTELNQRLLFSTEVVKGDPLTDTHQIVSGDTLSRLPDKLGLAVDWRLLQRVNGLSDPNKVRLDQKLKVVRGPFHAVVDKSDYRLDLFAGPPEEPGQWLYIRSFRVGLGEGDSTPTGSFVVKRESKLVNPYWVNPRTGERFDQNDPKNPIGERWIGIDGLGDDAVKTGYGIHGTIDPSSIGQQKSMGCVRMLDEDVDLVYAMLVEGISRVRIVE